MYHARHDAYGQLVHMMADHDLQEVIRMKFDSDIAIRESLRASGMILLLVRTVFFMYVYEYVMVHVQVSLLSRHV